MSDNPNKIQRLQLENFTCFEQADLEFSPGVNVFIGENGTGKTHLLKVMYFLKFYIKSKMKPLNELFGVPVYKLRRNNDSSLVARIENSNKSIISLRYPLPILGEISAFEIHTSEEEDSLPEVDCLFLPLYEMLSWQKGFSSLYLRREVSFDRTNFDLAISLGLGILKNSALEDAQQLAKAIRDAIKAEVFQRDERFYFKFDDLDSELEAPVVAQGINKLGQLYYLILNGSLTKDTILFWDEPETGLNPKYIKVVAQFLQTLANAGVQLFVATHDFLLAQSLSLAAEYREQTQAPDMKFFALYKGENGTEIETGATLAEIQNDAILEEYAAYYDLENEYFKQTITSP